MKTCFSEGKLMKQFGNPPPFLRELTLSTNPLFLSNFFMTPFFAQILKTRTSRPIFKKEQTMRTPPECASEMFWTTEICSRK